MLGRAGCQASFLLPHGIVLIILTESLRGTAPLAGLGAFPLAFLFSFHIFIYEHCMCLTVQWLLIRFLNYPFWLEHVTSVPLHIPWGRCAPRHSGAQPLGLFSRCGGLSSCCHPQLKLWVGPRLTLPSSSLSSFLLEGLLTPVSISVICSVLSFLADCQGIPANDWEIRCFLGIKSMTFFSSNSNWKQHGDIEKGSHQGIRQCGQQIEGRGHLLWTPLRMAQSLVNVTIEASAKELVFKKGALVKWSPLLLDGCAWILASWMMSMPESLEPVLAYMAKRLYICV